MASSEDEEQVRRAIVNTAVNNFDVLTQSQAINRRIALSATDAHLEAQRLKDQLVKLRVSSQGVARAGRLWARERKVVSGAMASYQRITTLMESPALVEECVASGMYHEAVVVVEHVLSYASPTDAFFVSLGQQLWSALIHSLDTVVLPRLAGPLTVDGAFKLTTFMLRLGVPAETLKAVFLAQRGVYLEQLRRDANGAGAAYACLLRHLSIYKVHVCEVVLQYSSCFDDRVEASASTARASASSPLADWAQEQSRCFLRDCERLLTDVTNGSELALVMEQCATSCATAATAHVDVQTALSSLITARIKALFSQHMTSAKQTFQASMATFTLSEPTAQSAAAPPPDDSSSAVAGALRPPPLQLTAWLPLAYALNGVLAAFNAVRKCLVPGVELHCAAEVVTFVRLAAQAVGRDTDLLASMDKSEQRTLQALAGAFVGDFYNYLLQCVEALLGPQVAAWVRAATRSDVARLDALTHHTQPLASDRSGGATATTRSIAPTTTTTAAAAPPPPPPQPAVPTSMADAFKHVRALLPCSRTAEEKAKRLALFKQFDKDGSGSLTFDETYKGLVTVLQLNQYTTRLRDISRRAFNKAKSMGTKDRGAGDEDLVEFLEFRLMLCYLYDYFELSALFEHADTSGDRLLDESEFVALAPQLAAWGVPMTDPHDAFRTIDANGSGQVTFDEFVNWAVSHKLDRDGDPDAVPTTSALAAVATAVGVPPGTGIKAAPAMYTHPSVQQSNSPPAAAVPTAPTPQIYNPFAQRPAPPHGGFSPSLPPQ